MSYIKDYTKFALSSKGADENTLVGDSFKNCLIVDDKLTSALTWDYCRKTSGGLINLPSGCGNPATLFYLYKRVSGGDMVPYMAMISLDGQMYYYDATLDEGSGAWVQDYNFGERTHAFIVPEESGTKRTYFCNTKGVMYYALKLEKTTVSKASLAGCWHCGRIFISVGDGKIIYSQFYGYPNYNVDLEKGGYFYLPKEKGEVCALVSFQGKLYVFCEYGIYVMEAEGDPLGFVVSPVAYAGDKIVGYSVTACGDAYICFLTHGGIFAFDGNKIKRLAENLQLSPSRTMDLLNGKALYYEGRYHVDFLTEEYLCDSVMVDLKSGDGSYVLMPMALSVINGKAYCVGNNELRHVGFGYDNLPEYVKGIFKVVTDFGTKKRKTLCRVWVKGNGTFQLTVSTGNATKTVDCTAYQEEPKRFDINQSGEKFTISFELTSKTRVESIRFEYETIG